MPRGRTVSALTEGVLEGVPGVPVLTSSASPMAATTGPTKNGLLGLPPAPPAGAPGPLPLREPPDPADRVGGRAASSDVRRASKGAASDAAPPPELLLGLGVGLPPGCPGAADGVVGSAEPAVEAASAPSG